MSLGLAVKRVYHFWNPSPRRWIRRNYYPIGLYFIGLYTGMECGPSPHASWYFLATILVMVGLQRWAGVGSRICPECGTPIGQPGNISS